MTNVGQQRWWLWWKIGAENNLALMASLSVVVGCVYEGPSARHGGYAFRPRTR